MEIVIKLKRIELTGKVVMWDKEDAGIQRHAGSVYFDNTAYQGFINHDGTVELLRNGRFKGVHKPTNLVTV